MLAMRQWLDRVLVLGGLLAVASAALLSAGLFTILSARSDNGIDLPSEGVLEEILRDAVEVSPATASPDSLQTASDQPPMPTPPSFPTSTPSPPPPSPPPPPPPPAPVALAIPRLEAAAPVVALGLDADRYPEVPDGPDKVAWHNFTAAPGQSSNAVFAAHYDWVDEFGEGMEGVFYHLSELEMDDVISVTLDDGSELEYRVTGNVALPFDDPNVLKLMDRTTRDMVTLITCGGTWESDADARYRGNYSHRVIVRAEKI